jgi:hypothetical protein
MIATQYMRFDLRLHERHTETLRDFARYVEAQRPLMRDSCFDAL